MPALFREPAGRRVDANQIHDVRADAADEPLARKPPDIVRLRLPAERIDQFDVGARGIGKKPDRAGISLPPVRGQLEPLAHRRRVQDARRCRNPASAPSARTPDACATTATGLGAKALLQFGERRECGTALSRVHANGGQRQDKRPDDEHGDSDTHRGRRASQREREIPSHRQVRHHRNQRQGVARRHGFLDSRCTTR